MNPYTSRVHKVSSQGPLTETKPNLMERFIERDKGNGELFFNLFTLGIETFCHIVGPNFVSCVVEVCRLGLEPL